MSWFILDDLINPLSDYLLNNLAESDKKFNA